MRDQPRRAVALVGATATGKSAIAHEVALRSGGDVQVVCVDSMTVYRGMDIATAKATPSQRREVRYHLLDLIEPREEFTVSQFQGAARAAAQGIWSTGAAVLYVGGTGLYGRAVIDDLDIPGQFPEVRAELEARSDDVTVLHQELGRRDPVAATRMEPTNRRRIVRALEVCIGAGRPFSSFGPGLRHYGAPRVVQVGLNCEFDVLDVRIRRRFKAWMEQGLLEEVVHLREQGMSRTARQAVGYRELLRHLEEGADLDECIEDAITQSRRLARRQRSWFQRDPRVLWFDEPADAAKRLEQVLNGSDGFVRD
ncbi:MAG: tRNA (adenosine(37)-N6)-dimethylallyltransferase MiaA [Acidobacteriota bacterium]|nr:tRNA (adenosine(37)-N6)-dimethylallyltransferase MiaA [Acidobacteriota bacterium]